MPTVTDDPMTLPKTEPAEPETIRRADEQVIDAWELAPKYAVIILNDDDNTVEFVVMVLQKVFSFGLERAVYHTFEAHETGRSAVWIGPLEVAELRAEQIRSFGGDPDSSSGKAQPIGVVIEPVE